LKIGHGAIVDNIVTSLYANFNNNRLQDGKALGLTTTTTTLVARGDPVQKQDR